MSWQSRGYSLRRPVEDQLRLTPAQPDESKSGKVSRNSSSASVTICWAERWLIAQATRRFRWRRLSGRSVNAALPFDPASARLTGDFVPFTGAPRAGLRHAPQLRAGTDAHASPPL